MHNISHPAVVIMGLWALAAFLTVVLFHVGDRGPRE